MYSICDVRDFESRVPTTTCARAATRDPVPGSTIARRVPVPRGPQGCWTQYPSMKSTISTSRTTQGALLHWASDWFSSAHIPVGLVLRDSTTYLAATVEGYSDVRMFALHRFREAKPELSPARTPRNFNLDTAIDQGLAQFGGGAPNRQIKLTIDCAPWVAKSLIEAPIAKDQALHSLPDGRTRASGSVVDSWQLRWWIMSRSDAVEVIEPATLRAQIAQAHSAAAEMYSTKTPVAA